MPKEHVAFLHFWGELNVCSPQLIQYDVGIPPYESMVEDEAPKRCFSLQEFNSPTFCTAKTIWINVAYRRWDIFYISLLSDRIDYSFWGLLVYDYENLDFAYHMF